MATVDAEVGCQCNESPQFNVISDAPSLALLNGTCDHFSVEVVGPSPFSAVAQLSVTVDDGGDLTTECFFDGGPTHLPVCPSRDLCNGNGYSFQGGEFTDDAGDGDGDGLTASGIGPVCASDNCANAFNPDQGDADADAAGDVCDNCAGVANASQADLDFDGQGDACDDDPDGDGVTAGDGDCEPLDGNISPNHGEDCFDAVDNNCDGDPDSDGDGFIVGCDNCVDLANPDQADFDSDGAGDLCDDDADNDGVPDVDDCAPNDAATYPGNVEDCFDPVDNNCDGDPDGDADGAIDGCDNCEGLANADQADLDSDGQGNLCDEDADGDGVTVGDGDCAPLNGNAYPGATELCADLVDNNCNGLVDEAGCIEPLAHDVNLSIDRGLAWMDSQGVFNNPSNAGDAAGLVALTLLEKREDATPGALTTGYSNAKPADKARLDQVMAYIIDRSLNAGFYAYRDGADLMALSVYLRTGGPDQVGAAASIAATFDRINATQGAHGYWCYHDGSCRDSSTTQLVMAGLAAAKAVFSDPAYADPVRRVQLNVLADRARAAYAANGTPNLAAPFDNERGHGYSLDFEQDNTLHQTASGLWSQIIGGDNLNGASVQRYLRWLYNRYNYQTLTPFGGGWDSLSFYYHLWTSSKAFNFIQNSGIAAAAGNLDTDDIGTLAPAGAPNVDSRQLHRDWTLEPQAAAFGNGAIGYYTDAPTYHGWYVDYALTLLNDQQPSGQFNLSQGTWETFSSQSYCLLVLERSVGGGCSDTDNDGLCDESDNCPTVLNPNQGDADDDGIGDACEAVGECEVNSDCADDLNVCTIDSCNAGLCIHLRDPACDCVETDGDGFCDDVDNCDDVANPDQANADGDEQGDACDACPAVPLSAETCDGVDNDCNGETADGSADAAVGVNCDGDDADLCIEGVTVCAGGAAICGDDSGDNADVCDGVDNDCNAETADGSQDATIGVGCDGDDSDLCDEGQTACVDGASTCGDDSADNGEACNGADDDCNAETADGATEATLGANCDGGDADLCNEGSVVCAAGALGCSDVSGDNADVCNGADDDCNADTADGSQDATIGVLCDGDDSDLCNEGQTVCVGGAAACSDATDGNVETCDGADNDCNDATADGTGDDLFGLACDGDDSDLCNEGAFACTGGAVVCGDDSGNTPDVCDGSTNDDCNPATDDGADDGRVNVACDGGDTDLCNEGNTACAEGQIACGDASGDNGEACNGADDDCNADTADGATEATLGSDCDGVDADLCNEGSVTCAAGALGCSDATGDNADTCNGSDDDCDPGTADGSGDGRVGVACDSSDTDLCAEGQTQCAEGQVACNEAAGDNVEACDGFDNDCNADTADGSGEATLGNACDGPDADACDEGVLVCGVGGLACNDDSNDLCGACEPQAETCDGEDDDCDSVVDEDVAGLGAACSAGLGSCAGQGVTTCANGAAGCTAVAIAPAANAGADFATCALTVTLDGSGSADDCGEVTYTWTHDGEVIANEESPEVTLDDGQHDVELTVCTANGLCGTDVVSVTTGNIGVWDNPLHYNPIYAYNQLWCSELDRVNRCALDDANNEHAMPMSTRWTTATLAKVQAVVMNTPTVRVFGIRIFGAGAAFTDYTLYSGVASAPTATRWIPSGSGLIDLAAFLTSKAKPANSEFSLLADGVVLSSANAAYLDGRELGEGLMYMTGNFGPGGQSTSPLVIMALRPRAERLPTCPAGYSVFIGTDGNDLITGTPGNDCIIGLGGNDTFDGVGGNDLLFGQRGADKLYGGLGDDTIYGGTCNDTLHGGQANLDIVDVGADVISGGTGADTIRAGDGADTVDGELGADVVYGGSGDDALSGGPGADKVYGEDGDDALHGGSGNDSVLDGGNGADVIYGNDGNDSLYGRAGADTLDGNAGNDLMYGSTEADVMSGGDGVDTMYGEAGNDTMSGGAENDIVKGGTENDSVSGDDGDDTVWGEAGVDFVSGGNGNDTMRGDAGNDTMSGGDGNDTMVGGNDVDTMTGDDGDDTMNGDAGNDNVSGGEGNDLVRGGSGNDRADGGNGTDTLHGDTGTDTCTTWETRFTCEL